MTTLKNIYTLFFVFFNLFGKFLVSQQKSDMVYFKKINLDYIATTNFIFLNCIFVFKFNAVKN